MPQQTAFAQEVLSEFSLPAQALDTALAAFAIQTGQQVVYETAIVRGKQAPAIEGRMTPREALDRLLAGTGIRVSATGNGVFTLRAPDAQTATSLSPVTVRGESESGWGSFDGYVAKRTVTGSKTDTPIIEVPQSISVIGAEEMMVRGTSDLSEVLSYTAGVVPSTEAKDRTGDGFIIRGFEAAAGSVYRDGMPLTVNFYDGQQEPYGLERVEVLKGAASLLYGTTAPGGIVNLVTKRPTNQPLHELNLELGSFDRKQISGDFGGPLGGTENGGSDWSYRLTFLKRDSDAFVDHVPDDREFVAAALRWQPSPATSLILRAEYLNRETAYVNGLPAEGTLLPNPNGTISRKHFPGIPGWNQHKSATKSVGYDFEHAFNPVLTLRHSLNYSKTDTSLRDGGPSGLSDDLSSGTRNFALSRDEGSTRLTTSTLLQAKFATGAVAHTVLAGVDTNKTKWGTDFYNYDVIGAPQSYFDPAYDLVVDSSTGRRNHYYDDTETESLGFYLQEQAKINDRWILVGGIRHERFRSTSTPTDGVTPATKESVSANTGRLGLVYLFDNGLAPYASYSQSYQPESGKDRQGNAFKPTEGEQYELGVRWQPSGSDTMLSASLYQLTKSNITVADPLDSNYLAQLGEIRSRGLELEARTKIGRHTRLIAVYAYTNAKTTKSSPLTPDEDGLRAGGVPRHAASVWVDHRFASHGLPGLRVGVGVRYLGSAPALFRSDLMVPSRTLVDMMASYDHGPWQFALNLNNAFDKDYVSCTYNCFYGEGRRLIGTVSYRW